MERQRQGLGAGEGVGAVAGTGTRPSQVQAEGKLLEVILSTAESHGGVGSPRLSGKLPPLLFRMDWRSVKGGGEGRNSSGSQHPCPWGEQPCSRELFAGSPSSLGDEAPAADRVAG